MTTDQTPATPQTPASAPVPAQDTPGGPGRQPDAPEPPQAALQRLHRLRGQLAAEHAKVVRADRHPRPDLDHLRVTPHNGIAAGLEIALFFANHHLREAREEAEDEHVCKPDVGLYYCPTSGETESDCHGGFDVCCDRPDLHQPAHACGNCEGEDPDTCLNNPRRTTPDNPATSGDAADNPLRVDAEAWRRKAIRRALAISKLRGTIDACTDLADEPVTDRTPWGDGYRTAISDLREVLREFGHLEPAAAEPGERS